MQRKQRKKRKKRKKKKAGDCMSVQVIKAKMKALTETCGHTINACSSVTASMNGVSGGNMMPLISNVERLISCAAQLNQMTQFIYDDTSIELHILFSEYNNELKQFHRYSDKVIKTLYEITGTALKIQALEAISRAGKAIGKNITIDIDTSGYIGKLKANTGGIMEYKMQTTLLQMKTVNNNKDLVVKEGNFK